MGAILSLTVISAVPLQHKNITTDGVAAKGQTFTEEVATGTDTIFSVVREQNTANPEANEKGNPYYSTGCLFHLKSIANFIQPTCVFPDFH